MRYTSMVHTYTGNKFMRYRYLYAPYCTSTEICISTYIAKKQFFDLYFYGSILLPQEEVPKEHKKSYYSQYCYGISCRSIAQTLQNIIYTSVILLHTSTFMSLP